MFFFFFRQKTAYEMRISDWSSDVCSSDLFGDDVVADQDQDRRRHDGVGGGDADALGAAARLIAVIAAHQRDDEAERRGLDEAGEDVGELDELQRQIGRASCRARVCQYV